MRRFWLVLVLLLTFPAAPPRAQEALARDQRISDLTELAAFYDKNYGPYEWKRDVIGFDLLRLSPWLQRIHHSDDLDFQEALIEYVAALDDAHAFIAFPTTFTASLGLGVDIYDGKVLIDSINRTALPIAQFPFVIGDELVSLDGVPSATLIQSFRKYATSANQRSTDRTAALRIVSRIQQFMPHLPEIGDTAVAAIRLASTGELRAFTLPWLKAGIPVVSQGPVPSPRRGNGRIFLPSQESGATSVNAGPVPSLFKLVEPAVVDETLPAYMDPIRPLLNASVSKDYYAVLNFGGKFPIFAAPPGFVIRLGQSSTHFFVTGTYMAGGKRIGFIRIPTMSPPSTVTALQQLDSEIAFFNSNTDALVIDVMRNPGGTISFVEALCQRFIPGTFRMMGLEIRATGAWLFSFASTLTNAQNAGAPPEIVQNLRDNYTELLRAYNELRGRSAPLAVNATGSLNVASAPFAYAKPILVVTDEFSASGADAFPAIMQDNQRATIFGMRTMGAGGSVVGFSGPAYTESFFRITVSLMNRGRTIVTPDFPPAPYVENIGVRPDIVRDYMTRENLMTGGAPFVQAITDAVLSLTQ